ATSSGPSSPRSACPQMGTVDHVPFESIAFPQCASEPFETHLPICESATCPHPCKVTRTGADLESTVQEVRYDAAGRWLATLPDSLQDPEVNRREATYEDGRVHAVRSQSTYGEYTETFYHQGP